MNKTYMPDYYNHFHCTAEKCRFNCCREWTIAVDSETKARWKNVRCPDPMQSKKNHLKDYVTSKGITLREDGRCPFLREDGLCHIVSTYGEGMLSRTCHTFPREIHEFADRTELTLSMCCPEALSLLWKAGQFQIQAEGGVTSEADSLFALRDFCIEVMGRKEYSIPLVLKSLFYYLLEADTEKICPEDLLPVILEVEKITSDSRETYTEQNALFLDLIDNYRKKNIYSDFIEPLAHVAEQYDTAAVSYHENPNDSLSEAMLSRLYERQGEFASVWSEYTSRLRLLMQEEIYSTLLLPEGDLYSMTMKWQWLAITYTAIRQACFLRYHIDSALSEDAFLDSVMFVLRMTGYNEADIEEYFSDSFESVIWEWGYMQLLLG